MNEMRFKSLDETNLQNIDESNNNIDNILRKQIPNMNYYSNKKKNIEIINYIKKNTKMMILIMNLI